MCDLETLIRQKKELEAQIRALTQNAKQYGNAKVGTEHYPTSKPDRHFLAVYYQPLDNGRKKWQSIFSANTRQEVVNAIPGIIKDLRGLYCGMKNSPKFILVKHYGAPLYINVNWIESVNSIDGETHIWIVGSTQGPTIAYEPIEEIMRRITDG